MFEYRKIFEQKNSPPVKLKECPNAEKELRGVKSGLLGLLIGLHKPELHFMEEQEDNTHFINNINLLIYIQMYVCTYV